MQSQGTDHQCHTTNCLPNIVQVEQFTNALQRQSIAREEEGDDYEEEGGLPEAVEDLADEMAVAALSRTISMREDPSPGLTPPLTPSGYAFFLISYKSVVHFQQLLQVCFTFATNCSFYVVCMLLLYTKPAGSTTSLL